MSLLARLSRRYLLRHPWLAGLSILGVALGVALVISIDLANQSARRAFQLSSERVTGRATHQVVGANQQLSETVYRSLRTRGPIREMAPVVEDYVSVAKNGRILQTLGVDPLAEGPFRPYANRESGVDLGVFMATPGAGLIAEATAQAMGKSQGDTLWVQANGQRQVLTLAGVIVPEDERSAEVLADLLIVDIATAQEWFGREGWLDYIDLRIPEGGIQQETAIRDLLPPEASLLKSSARTETLSQMTRAFELNLTALSLLALIVGMFLVYNSITFSVVQRRNLIGRLRTIGVTRKQVFSLVIREAALVAVTGTGLGLMLGIVLGQGLVQLVTRTINDLYYVVSVRSLHIDGLTLLKGIALGIGATLLTALRPAREAARAPAGTVLQRSLEESRFRTQVPRLALAGLGLGLVGWLMLVLSEQSITISYVALFFILLGFALATPWGILGLVRLARPLNGMMFGMIGRMATSGISASLSRTGIAIAALMVAFSATIGVGVMVDSFRQTVATWLNYTLQADIYISPQTMVLRRVEGSLDSALVQTFASYEGAEGVSTGRPVTVRSSLGDIDLIAFNLNERSWASFSFKEGSTEDVKTKFEEGRHIIVSEPFTYRFDVGKGDSIPLYTQEGLVEFEIVGVFFDYGSDLGTAMMSRSVYDQYYDDPATSTMALFLKDGVAPEDAVQELRQRVPAGQEVLIRSNQTLRNLSLAVFDRTFTITTVLRLLAIGVAFIGVLSALMALQLERIKELAVLRATGLTRRQVLKYVTLQTGSMGFMAGLLSLPLGLVLASVLIFVINKRSFGWTMQLQVPPEVLVQAIFFSMLAALLAGLYPAYRMAKTPPAEALKS